VAAGGNGGLADPAPTAATTVSATGQAGLTAIRVGEHAAYDEIVFQFANQVPTYSVSYVPAVWLDPKGTLVPLPGRSYVRVVFHPANAATYRGTRTLSPYFPTLLQVKAAGDFEGYLSFGIGLSGHTGIHVLTLTRPGRVVIEFAHAKLPRFPGVWYITTWWQYWVHQTAVENGHQPWLLSPAAVVRAWAAGRWTRQPTISQTGPGTFKVSVPGTKTVVTLTGTRPVRTGPAQIWVITSAVYAR
jgi:hypothetical protein